jgi:hypothetical protein
VPWKFASAARIAIKIIFGAAGTSLRCPVTFDGSSSRFVLNVALLYGREVFEQGPMRTID